MGFPSPAADYAESPLSLDQLLIDHPSATYFFKAAEDSYRNGIMKGALLIVDSSLKPSDGVIIVCDIGGEYRLKRYRSVPFPHLENMSTALREDFPEPDAEGYDAVYGVVTYIINNGNAGKFIDYPAA